MHVWEFDNSYIDPASGMVPYICVFASMLSFCRYTDMLEPAICELL